MCSSEIDYLRYVYGYLDIRSRIFVQNYFQGIPPPNYYIYVCQECKERVAQITCQYHGCGKIICMNCVGQCLQDRKILCSTHSDRCNICKVGCACVKCREYITEYICNTCSENDEISYTCGCMQIERQDKCIHCEREMDPDTKERIS